ncbi:hypothetical protein [Phaeobacter sp. J2-8]|uniref:hypothetical protein n=1 Tax=Phaeobacter sp. J2-8 TaxID=2931394 RepID=UPI001FD4C21E|nr:hypothetical protein [Phaeobacter sp. J2-8]
MFVGLLIAFVLVMIFSRPATRNCRWRRGREDGQVVWTCAYCGAKTPGSDRESRKIACEQSLRRKPQNFFGWHDFLA